MRYMMNGEGSGVGGVGCMMNGEGNGVGGVGCSGVLEMHGLTLHTLGCSAAPC